MKRSAIKLYREGITVNSGQWAVSSVESYKDKSSKGVVRSKNLEPRAHRLDVQPRKFCTKLFPSWEGLGVGFWCAVARFYFKVEGSRCKKGAAHSLGQSLSCLFCRRIWWLRQRRRRKGFEARQSAYFHVEIASSL